MSNAGSSEELYEAIARLEAEVAALRASRRRLAEASHSERGAIERALHDGVQQHLVALAVDLQRLADLIDRDGSAARALLAEMRANIREAIDEANRLSARTSPPIGDGRGLVAALRSAATDAGVAALIEVPAAVSWPAEISAALYWTWLDAIAAGSSGSEARMRVNAAADGLTFAVTVVGRYDEARAARLRDRIEALDGHLTVDERHDGSVLQGWLPLPA